MAFLSDRADILEVNRVERSFRDYQQQQAADVDEVKGREFMSCIIHLSLLHYYIALLY